MLRRELARESGSRHPPPLACTCSLTLPLPRQRRRRAPPPLLDPRRRTVPLPAPRTRVRSRATGSETNRRPQICKQRSEEPSAAARRRPPPSSFFPPTTPSFSAPTRSLFGAPTSAPSNLHLRHIPAYIPSLQYHERRRERTVAPRHSLQELTQTRPLSLPPSNDLQGPGRVEPELREPLGNGHVTVDPRSVKRLAPAPSPHDGLCSPCSASTGQP